MTLQIPPEVANVLSRSTVEGLIVKLPAGRIERPVYVATDKVLKALGGKWDRRVGGHAFPFDPAPKLASALDVGSVVSRQQKLQLFETPPSLAARLCSLIEIQEGDICLEPSAGLGRIVVAMAERMPDKIIAVEIDEDNARHLVRQACQEELIVGDFLQQRPDALRATAVAMNPPFARNQDIRHVMHAYECLEPGGRLAAIVSEHGFISQERACVEWREWLSARGAYVERVPAGAFKESGTAVATRIIVVHRPTRHS